MENELIVNDVLHEKNHTFADSLNVDDEDQSSIKVLNSGKLDMDYLGKVLEFALITLQKLSAPATKDELKVAHLSMLKELAEICQAGNDLDHLHSIGLINLCIFSQFISDTKCELQ